MVLKLSPGEHCQGPATRLMLFHSPQPVYAAQCEPVHLTAEQFVQKDAIRENIEGPTKTQKHYIHCLPIIHQTGDIEEDQITKARFSLQKPMLTMLDNSSVLYMPFNPLPTQDNLQNFSTYRGSTNRSVFSWAFSHALFVHRYKIGCLPVCMDLPRHP